jgi:hypothetical protein
VAFADITNLAQQESMQEKEKRRREIEKLDRAEQSATKEDMSGVLGLAAHPGIHLSPSAQLEEADARLSADQRTQQYQQKRDDLVGAIPSQYDTLVKHLGKEGASLAMENPQTRQDELSVDPRGRAERLDQKITALKSQYGMGGADSGHIDAGPNDRIWYKEEPSGTLDFTNIPSHAGEGFRRYNADNGEHKDLGAPGGGYGRIGGGQGAGGDTDMKQQLLDSLTFERDAARGAKLTPKEQAAGMLSEEPKWQETFANEGYAAGKDKIRQAIAGGTLHPEIGGHIEKQMDSLYGSLAHAEATGGDPADTVFKDTLNIKRGASPSEVQAAHAITQSVPGAAEQAHMQASQAGAAHAQAAAAGPGTQAGASDVERQRAALAAVGAHAEPDTREPDADADDPLGGLLHPDTTPSLVATGGHGESGLEGLLHDYQSYRAGEGRAGYGESGPKGVLKDIAAFYGVRLPQDALEALLTVGGARGGKALGSKLTGLRSVENALGKF